MVDEDKCAAAASEDARVLRRCVGGVGLGYRIIMVSDVSRRHSVLLLDDGMIRGGGGVDEGMTWMMRRIVTTVAVA